MLEYFCHAQYGNDASLQVAYFNARRSKRRGIVDELFNEVTSIRVPFPFF